MLDQGFEAVNSAEAIAGAAAVVVCVPTPLTDHGSPDLGAVHAAVDDIAAHLAPGTLVVLESTTYPGTTDEVVRPRLEAGGLRAGRDFHLAFSPERIDPGNPRFGLENTPKVVGGITEDCTKAARALYERFVGSVVEAKGTREAEMAKLLENTYRHVNIALVNEMSMFCREIGVDLWDAIRCAASKPFGFAPFYPARESAATASLSTPTTCPTRYAPSVFRSASWSWLRRSTTGCPCMWSTGRPTCSTIRARRSAGRASC